MTAEQLDAGVLLWFNNPNYTDNNVGDHPGYGFIGVVDADQTLMKTGLTPQDSARQVRDAAFSRLTQMSGRSGDTHLDANPEFNDTNDYSSPSAPAAGLVLPKLGLRFAVNAQAGDSTTATVQLTAIALALAADFSAAVNGRTATFSNTSVGGTGALSYEWNFGDDSAVSHEVSPTHTYAADGNYTVTLTVTDGEAKTNAKTQTVSVAVAPVNSNFTVTKSERKVTFSNSSSGGLGALTYAWNFGDGSAASSNTSPTHTYAADGSYTVTLTVTDSEGSSNVSTQTVTVAATPVNNSGGGGGGNVAFITTLLLALFSAARRRQ
jgi:immune inhibitor A